VTEDAILTLLCADGMLSHQLRVTLYEEDGTGLVEAILPSAPFLWRLRNAWSYLIGRPYCGVVDIVLNKSQVHELSQFLVTYQYIDFERNGA
jgi:hypothetical protein